MGCANGSYYMFLNVVDLEPIDPVILLQEQYEVWRDDQVGRPDAILSTVDLAAPALPADDLSRLRVTVDLVDIDGVPLGQGGTNVTAEVRPKGTIIASAGPVTDHGDGTWSLIPDWEVPVDVQRAAFEELRPDFVELLERSFLKGKNFKLPARR